MVDLSQVISVENVLIFILDNHRPLNLDNLFCGIDCDGSQVGVAGQAQIIVFDDGDCEDLVEERAAYFALLEDSDEDDEYGSDSELDDRDGGHDNDEVQDLSDHDADNDPHEDTESETSNVEDESNLTIVKEQNEGLSLEAETNSRSGSESDPMSTSETVAEMAENTNEERDNVINEESDDEEDDDEDDEQMIRKPTRKRNRSVSPATNQPMTAASRALVQLRKNKKLCENLLREYYNLTFNGTPAASMMYTLSSQLARDSNEFLWHSLVGLSAQYLHNQLNSEQYLFQVELFKDEVKRFNPNSGNFIRDSEAGNHSTLIAADADDHSVHYNPNELKIMLYRHSSLYDSMYHSSYVASKLGIWRERGRQKLRNLLAKMGFSLTQSQQKYLDCDLDLRKVMETRLEEKGILYGLDSLTFESFVRFFGFKTIISACDAVYALAALIELSPSLSKVLSIDLKSFNIAKKGFGKNKTSKSSPEDESEKENKDEERQGFYMAFDALDDVSLMLKGIEMAQMLQKIVVRTGTQIIEERLVKTLKTFRLVVLKDSPDLSVFSHPLTLLKLSLFMVEAMKQTGKAYLPFVIAALSKSSETYLVVGVSEGKSSFAEAFRKCADVTRASMKQDRFDCSVIEIAKNDLAKFMEHLQIFL